jgi:hypothetical protein
MTQHQFHHAPTQSGHCSHIDANMNIYRLTISRIYNDDITMSWNFAETDPNEADGIQGTIVAAKILVFNTCGKSMIRVYLEIPLLCSRVLLLLSI